MATEEKIIIKKEDAELTKLNKNLKESQNEFLKLSLSGKASSDELKKAGAELTRYSNAVKKAKTELREFTDAQKKSSVGGFLSSLKDVPAISAGLATVTAALTALSFQAINSGAEFGVLREAFQGTEKDLQLFRKATAGTVTDANLIKLSNQATDLGVSLKDQALLLSLAEDAADKYGGSVEENFSKVISATDGSAKGLRAVGISVIQFKQELDRLTDAQGVNIDSLDAEAQMNLRLQAIYKLTGTTIESVNKKRKDNKDFIDSLTTSVKNFVDKAGNEFTKGLAENAEQLGKLSGGLIKVRDDFSFVEIAAKSFGLVLSKFNTIGFLSFLIDELGNVKQLLGEIGGIGFLRDGAKLSTQQAEVGKGDALGQFAKLTPSLNTDASSRVKEKRTGAKSPAQKDLDIERVSLSENLRLVIDNNKLLVKKIDYLDAIAQVTAKITELQGFEQTNKILTEENKLLQFRNELQKEFLADSFRLAQQGVSSLTPLQRRSLISKSGLESVTSGVEGVEKTKSAQELREDLIGAFSDATTNLEGFLNTFNLGTETALAKILHTFDDLFSGIRALLEFISAVNTAKSVIGSILSFVPGGGLLAQGAGRSAGLPQSFGGNGGSASNYFKIDLDAVKIYKMGAEQYNQFKGAIQL